jgi:hypothetical protein
LRLPGDTPQIFSFKAESANSSKESSTKVKEAFAKILLILCLISLGGFDLFVAQELLQRDLDVWCRCIIYHISQLHKLPLPHHLDLPQEQIQVQVLFLLRELHSVVSGIRTYIPHWFIKSPTFTARDYIMLYGLLCGVRTATSQEFSTIDLRGLQDTILRSRLFLKLTDGKRIQRGYFNDFNKLGRYLVNSLPIIHSQWVRLCHSMQRGEANRSQASSATTVEGIRC